MLLLTRAVEVCGVADLGFYLLLAIAVVVVRDHGDDHAALVAAGDLERVAAVVALVRVAVAHAVADLTRRRLVRVRQPELQLRQAYQMGREDHAAGVAGPT